MKRSRHRHYTALSTIVMHTTNTPTAQASNELQFAFTFLNDRLFNGTLPDCLITVRARNRSLGYFAASRFAAADADSLDEIALNPAHFDDVGGTLQTLVHEMCHQWQQHFGRPSRANYHNKQWAEKMVSIGLIPSDTGQPGGKQTGQQMSDYPAENGSFARVTAALIATDFTITWSDAVREKPKTGAGGRHAKFTCRHCGYSQQLTLSARLICGLCHPEIEPLLMEAEL